MRFSPGIQWLLKTTNLCAVIETQLLQCLTCHIAGHAYLVKGYNNTPLSPSPPLHLWAPYVYNNNTTLCIMVPCASWYPVHHGTLCIMVPCAWYPVHHGTLCMVPCAWYPVHGTLCMVPCAWYPVHGTLCMVPCAWYPVHHGTLCIMVPCASWYPVHHGTLCIMVPCASWYPVHHGTLCMVPCASWYPVHGTLCMVPCATLCIMVPCASWYPVHHGTLCIMVPCASWYPVHGTLCIMVPCASWYPVHGTLCMVPCAWYPVHGTLCMVPCASWYPVHHGTLCMVPCAWYPVHGTLCMVPCAWYPVHGTLCMVPCAWYPVHGTLCMVPCAWYPVHVHVLCLHVTQVPYMHDLPYFTELTITDYYLRLFLPHQDSTHLILCRVAEIYYFLIISVCNILIPPFNSHLQEQNDIVHPFMCYHGHDTYPFDMPFIPSFTPMSPATTPGSVFSVCVSLRGTRNWCTPWHTPLGVQSWANKMAKLATFPRFPTQHLAASMSGV